MWVVKDMWLLDYTFCALSLYQKVRAQKPRAGRSQTSTGPALDCRNVKEERVERKGKGRKARQGHEKGKEEEEEEEECVHMRRRQAAHAGWYS
ncbi:Hypothetical predicted protein [Xyrichtys novacula]|uniref:Uncharacterized protein n=1 Tax=Xyrichtys novacula TaxID=13765 RepID=A0AAV1FHX5_XYRNO|nr:Hypothetical predicted protein [Xyrichtys novacula]